MLTIRVHAHDCREAASRRVPQARADGRSHTFYDKVPIFTAMPLTEASRYPQPGLAACEVLERFEDDRGRSLVRVSTERPFGITSTGGLTEFVVLAETMMASAGPPGWRDPEGVMS